MITSCLWGGGGASTVIFTESSANIGEADTMGAGNPAKAMSASPPVRQTAVPGAKCKGSSLVVFTDDRDREMIFQCPPGREFSTRRLC